MEEFPERLRRLRESKKPIKKMNVTSELIGLSGDMLRRYERGESEPTRPALILIARYYDVSLDYLCCGEEKI